MHVLTVYLVGMGGGLIMCVLISRSLGLHISTVELAVYGRVLSESARGRTQWSAQLGLSAVTSFPIGRERMCDAVGAGNPSGGRVHDAPAGRLQHVALAPSRWLHGLGSIHRCCVRTVAEGGR